MRTRTCTTGPLRVTSILTQVLVSAGFVLMLLYAQESPVVKSSPDVTAGSPDATSSRRGVWLVPTGSIPTGSGKALMVCDLDEATSTFHPWSGVLLTENNLSGLPCANTAWGGSRVVYASEPYTLGHSVSPELAGYTCPSSKTVKIGLYAESLNLFLAFRDCEITVEGSRQENLVCVPKNAGPKTTAVVEILCPPDYSNEVSSLLFKHKKDLLQKTFPVGPKLTITKTFGTRTIVR